MPDYKEMYLTLFRATEKAINILIDAQQECEEMYLNRTNASIFCPNAALVVYLNAPKTELILLERTESDKQ